MKEKLKKLADSPSGSILLLVIAVVYTISPIDLIPDIVPVVGWLDDLGLDVTAIGLIIKGFLDRKAKSYIESNANKNNTTKAIVQGGQLLQNTKKSQSTTSTTKTQSTTSTDNKMKAF